MATENVLKIPLSEILVDLDWNARGKASVLQEGKSAAESEETGKMTTDELSASIEAQGQDTPCHVIANPDKKDRKHPYMLIAGFKRYTAVHRLAERTLNNKEYNPIKTEPSWSSKNPTLLCKVDTYTSKSEARLMNLRENTARSTLTVPDMAYGVQDYIAELAAEGKPKPTQAELGATLGIGQGYVSKLTTIIAAITPISGNKIGKDWRTSRNPVTLNDMLAVVKQSTPDRILEAYTTLVGKKGEPDKKPEADPNAWLDKAKKSAEDFAMGVGVLQASGQITGGESIEWVDCIDDLRIAEVVSYKKGADAKEVVQIGRAAQAGFAFGLTKVASAKADEAKKAAEKIAEKAKKKNEKEDAKAAGGEKTATKNGKGEEAGAN